MEPSAGLGRLVVADVHLYPDAVDGSAAAYQILEHHDQEPVPALRMSGQREVPSIFSNPVGTRDHFANFGCGPPRTSAKH